MTVPIFALIGVSPSGERVIAPGAMSQVVFTEGRETSRTRIYAISARRFELNRVQRWLTDDLDGYVAEENVAQSEALERIFQRSTESDAPEQTGPMSPSSESPAREGNERSESMVIAAYAAAVAAGKHVELKSKAVEVGLGGPPGIDQLSTIEFVNGMAIQSTADVARVVSETTGPIAYEDKQGRIVKIPRADAARAKWGPSYAPLSNEDPTLGGIDILISLDGEGEGDSAGLPAALAALLVLKGRDLNSGKCVAATGSIFVDGQVGRVDHIAQKALTAANSRCTTLLVPPGTLEGARSIAPDLSVIEVSSLQHAYKAIEKMTHSSDH